MSFLTRFDFAVEGANAYANPTYTPTPPERSPCKGMSLERMVQVGQESKLAPTCYM